MSGAGAKLRKVMNHSFNHLFYSLNAQNDPIFIFWEPLRKSKAIEKVHGNIGISMYLFNAKPKSACWWYNIPQRYCIQETHQRYFLHSCCTSRLPWLSGLKRLLLSALASFSKQWKVTGTTSLAKVVVHVSPWKGVSGEGAANYYWPTGTGLVAYLVPIFGVLKAGA